MLTYTYQSQQLLRGWCQSEQDRMSTLVKRGYRRLKYFLIGEYLVITVREYILLVLESWSKCASGVWSGLLCASGLAIARARSCHLLQTHRDPPREEELPVSRFSPRGQPARSRATRAGASQKLLRIILLPPRHLSSTPCSAWPDLPGHSGTWAAPPAKVLVCKKLLCWQTEQVESCSYPGLRHATDNGSLGSSHIPVKGTLFLNNLRNI